MPERPDRRTRHEVEVLFSERGVTVVKTRWIKDDYSTDCAEIRDHGRPTFGEKP